MATDARTRLHSRALRWLSQREHSRSELRARLLRAARPGVADADADARGDAQDGRDAAAGAALVDAVLDQLQSQGWLSDQRFVDSRVHQREAGWGVRRIRHELRQHGLQLDDAQQQALAASERARAQALWSRRFGHPPATPAERARQMRFLAARGFSGDAIRHALGGAHADELPVDVDET